MLYRLEGKSGIVWRATVYQILTFNKHCTLLNCHCSNFSRFLQRNITIIKTCQNRSHWSHCSKLEPLFRDVRMLGFQVWIPSDHTRDCAFLSTSYHHIHRHTSPKIQTSLLFYFFNDAFSELYRLCSTICEDDYECLTAKDIYIYIYESDCDLFYSSTFEFGRTKPGRNMRTVYPLQGIAFTNTDGVLTKHPLCSAYGFCDGWDCVGELVLLAAYN
jgi:hypothetical protein